MPNIAYYQGFNNKYLDKNRRFSGDGENVSGK